MRHPEDVPRGPEQQREWWNEGGRAALVGAVLEEVVGLVVRAKHKTAGTLIALIVGPPIAAVMAALRGDWTYLVGALVVETFVIAIIGVKVAPRVRPPRP